MNCSFQTWEFWRSFSTAPFLANNRWYCSLNMSDSAVLGDSRFLTRVFKQVSNLNKTGSGVEALAVELEAGRAPDDDALAATLAAAPVAPAALAALAATPVAALAAPAATLAAALAAPSRRRSTALSQSRRRSTALRQSRRRSIAWVWTLTTLCISH